MQRAPSLVVSNATCSSHSTSQEFCCAGLVELTPCQPQVAFSAVGDATDDANPSGFFLVDPYSGKSTILMNNFFGLRFNGLGEIQTLTDG